MTLSGRVALVTGAAQAAGRGYAIALASAGASVVVADQFEDEGRETVTLIEKGGGTAGFCALDVTREESTLAAAAYAVDTFGRLDVLVNNAATYRATTRTPMTELTLEQWDKTMAVFVRGPWLMAKSALPHLKRSPCPAIINHTSVAAYGVDQWLDYGTARGAVIALTKSMARELARDRIRVNAVAVGSMGDEAVTLGVVEREEQMLQTEDFKRQLIPRLGSGDDVAGVAVFLAGDGSSYMTGQTLVLDGGKFFLG
ncbi:MAG: SDR family oxidoreductase [Acidimicrobiaceae bacterium]|nr:SDR family oxidoreductase [Acidimicrobiaceae bacterium]